MEAAVAKHIPGWSRADTLALVDADPAVRDPSPIDFSTDKFVYVDLLVRSNLSPLCKRVAPRRRCVREWCLLMMMIFLAAGVTPAHFIYR
jgi:hypothetical protein